MNSILITGGTGHLGQKVADSLVAVGQKPGILSSKKGLSDKRNMTYYAGNLADNEGLNEAVHGMNIIIHCASNPRNFQAVDIEGTKNLLSAISHQSIKHFVYISIVGVDKSNYPYYQAKLKVENLLAESKLPYSIVRTTQFHHFVLNMIQNLIRENVSNPSILKIPKGLKFQSIATQEVAELLAKISLGEPRGLLPDFGGPQILSFEEMTTSYLEACQLSQRIQPEMTSEIRHELFRSGVNLCPDHTFGKETWNAFLKTIHHK